MARISEEARVLPVLSKTRKERANPPAIPPIAPRAEAVVTSVKFFVQSVCFILISLLPSDGFLVLF